MNSEACTSAVDSSECKVLPRKAKATPCFDRCSKPENSETTWQSRGEADPWQHKIDCAQFFLRTSLNKKAGSKQPLDLDACKHAPVRLRLPPDMAVGKLTSKSRARFSHLEQNTDRQNKREPISRPGLFPGSVLWLLRGQRLAIGHIYIIYI